MFNAFRFIRYTFVGISRRHRHQRSFLRQHGLTILASGLGALVLSMPAWMILLGVI